MWHFRLIKTSSLLQKDILISWVVGLSHSIVFGIVISVFNFIYFLDVLIFKQNRVQYKVVIVFRFLCVICRVFFQHVKLSQVIVGHFQVFLRSHEVIAFSFNAEIDFVLLFIKIPQNVRNLPQRLGNWEDILCNWGWYRLVIIEKLFSWSLAFWMRIRQIKIMPDKDVIYSFAVFMVASFVIDFGFLWWEYLKTLNMVHFGFPFFEVWEILEFINYPVENDNITAFHSVDFPNFLLFPMIIYWEILVFSNFFPSVKILNARQ